MSELVVGGERITVTEEAPVANAPVLSARERMLEAAIAQGGVEAVRELIALEREEEDRRARQALNVALANFQSRQPSIGYNARGAHGAQYATLDHIMDIIRPALARNGLSVGFDSAPIEGEAEKLSIICIVRHDGGASISASFPIPMEKPSNRMNDTQRAGSAMSYGQRYALKLALNLTTGDVDDDGEASVAAAEPITAEQAADLSSLIDEVSADRSGFLKWAGVDALEHLPARKYKQAVALLEKKRGQS